MEHQSRGTKVLGYRAFGQVSAFAEQELIYEAASYVLITDTETGLSLLTNRYYDAGKGRFITRDPIGYGGGINLYGFCGNNPVMESDPSGFASGTIVGSPVPNPLNSEEERVTEQLMKGIYRFVYRRAGTTLLRAAAFNPVTLGAGLFFMSQTRVADDSTGPGSPYYAQHHSVASNPALLRQTLGFTPQQYARLRILRRLAKSHGWVRDRTSAIEEYGVYEANGDFSFRIKIRDLPSPLNPGAASQVPRFDYRYDVVNGQGLYMNPFTGQKGNRKTVSHIPL